MTTPARVSAQTVYRRVLWAVTIASWTGSTALAMMLLAHGVRLDSKVLLLWTGIVVQLSLGAIIVSCIPSAEAIATRAYAVGLEDGQHGNEFASRRRG